MDADAIHAGIDGDHDVDRFLGKSRDGIKRRQIHRVVYGENEILRHTERHIFRERQPQDINRTGETGFAKLRAFFGTRDGSGGVSFLQRDTQHFGGTVPVGIGLHDGERLYIFRKMLANDAQIVTQRAQIDDNGRNGHDDSFRL